MMYLRPKEENIFTDAPCHKNEPLSCMRNLRKYMGLEPEPSFFNYFESRLADTHRDYARARTMTRAQFPEKEEFWVDHVLKR